VVDSGADALVPIWLFLVTSKQGCLPQHRIIFIRLCLTIPIKNCFHFWEYISVQTYYWWDSIFYRLGLCNWPIIILKEPKKCLLTVWMKENWSVARVATAARKMRSAILLCILSQSGSLNALTVLASRQFVSNKSRGIESQVMGKYFQCIKSCRIFYILGKKSQKAINHLKKCTLHWKFCCVIKSTEHILLRSWYKCVYFQYNWRKGINNVVKNIIAL